MRVLVFCEDLYHPAATARAGLAPLTAGGKFSFDWIENAAGWRPEVLREYRAVLLSKSNHCSSTDKTPWLAGPTEHALSDYVSSGGGLLAVHSGTASYKDWPSVRALLGGVFISHPEPCDVTIEPVAGNALTGGVGTFTVYDEHYHMVMDDPVVDVFLRTKSLHGAQPGGWTRRHGKGKVAVITPGHTPRVWTNGNFQRLLANALEWLG